MKKLFLWAVSIFFGLITLCCLFSLPSSWGGLLFIIPAVLLNPKFIKFFDSKDLHFKWPVYVSSIVLPLIISIGTAAAYNSTPQKSTLAKVNSDNISSLITSSKTSSKLTSQDISNSSSSIVSVPEVKNDSKLKVHYIDVGQGDSEFLELPNGQTMLIDAGNPENGTQIVSYINGQGYKKIDYLIATHPHADHIGGMAEVVNDLGIGKVYMPKKITTTKTFEELVTAIKNKGLGINVAKAGVNILKTGNLEINILAPVNITGNDLNQYSAVIKVSYGANKFLFMGDAGQPSEEQITADISADVLKVGHHGSSTATSQEFINKVHPKYSVIEVGRGNSYGHPTALTLSKLQNIGSTIYRTDKDGTIIFTSDAKTITVNKKASTQKEQAPPSTSTSSENLTKSSHTNVTPIPNNNKSVIVYVTDTGKKYHVAGCQYLKKSKHAITLKDAKAQGYEPCKKCHPPE